jgi:acyl-CoA synthetase (AMP-forming)/AMP-acid ligase II
VSHRPLTVGALYDRAVAQGGDRVAVVDGEKRFTYADLGAGAARLAGALGALGIGPGARVAFLMANCGEYVICEYAVAARGATRVPLAVALGSDDHVYMLNFARCEALVYHEKLASRVLAMAPALTHVRHFLCVADDAARVPPGHLHLQELLAGSAKPAQAVEVDPEAIAGIYFTGGTTGRPKGVMLSHRAWFYTYYAELLDFGVGWGEAFVFTTPMTHAAGCLILPVLLRLGRLIVLDHFDAEGLLATIAREKATATLVVPTMLYALLDHPRRDAYQVGSLRNVLYGAAPIAPERLAQALAVWGPIFTQFFGQTEAPMALTALQREDHLQADPQATLAALTSAGRATYQTELRLVDEAGREVAPGEEGEILARTPNVMSGYLDDPLATAAALEGGWLHTGDVARLGPGGLLTIVDRKKDLIVSGGFNVFPREVEDVLFTHPAVSQAAVIGVPSDKWGEEVKALVVLRAGAAASPEALIEYVKARKGSVMAPKSVDFVDRIPVTNLGKVDKKAIRARYWSGRSRQV